MRIQYAALIPLLFFTACVSQQKPVFLRDKDTTAAVVEKKMEKPPPEQNNSPQYERASLLFQDALRRTKVDPHGALKIYEEVNTLTPERWEPHYNAGLLELSFNEPEKAEKKFITALQKKGPIGKVYNVLGIAAMKLEKKALAVDYFKKALAAEHSEEHMINTAHALQAMGRLDDAMQYYRRLEDTEAFKNNLQYNMSVLLYTKGEYERAKKQLEKVQDEPEIGTSLSFSKARILLELGEYESALKLFEEMLDKNPDDPAPYKNMGIIYEIYLNNVEKAVEFYTAYLSKSGKDDQGVKAWLEVAQGRAALKKEALK